MKILYNPDKRKIYHVWHYCSKCLRVWTHSQGAFDEMRLFGPRCCLDNLVNVNGKVETIEIDESEKARYKVIEPMEEGKK